MLLSSKGRLCLLTGTLLSMGVSTSSNAQDFPKFSGEVVVEIQNEYTPDSDDAATEGYNNIFSTSEAALALQFNENFSIESTIVWETIQGLDTNKSNEFDNEGIYIEEIKLSYSNGPWAAFAGKFNPSFGYGWDAAAGIWGVDFAEDYEIAEKIGGGVSYTFDTENAGAHTLTASTFFADTTFLSDSLVTKRGQTNKSDGGVSNTEDFSSFVASLEGEDLAGVENLYYQVGYRNQSEGDADVGAKNETGFVVALGHGFDVTDKIGVDALIEYVDINNFEAGADDHQYLTLSAAATIDENWNVAASYTDRSIDSAGGDSDDHLFQLSGGYDFGQGTTADLGWRNAEEAGSNSDIVGFLVTHTFEF